MFLSFLTLNNDALTVFYWLMDLTAAGVLISWSSILFNHIRLKLAMKKQQIPMSRLPWHNSWTRTSCSCPVAEKSFPNADLLCSVQLIRVLVHVPPDSPDERLQCLHQGKLGPRNIRGIVLVSVAPCPPHRTRGANLYNQGYTSRHFCVPDLEICQEDQDYRSG